jgi:hypothetical protein
MTEKSLGKVDYYTHGTVTLDVSFPENRVVCQWCRFCRNEDSLKRWKCLLTDEYIVYPFYSVGNECPIILNEVQK